MKMTLRAASLITCFFCAISLLISRSIDLKQDELGALLNIYIPPAVCIITLLLIVLLFTFFRNHTIRLACLISCIILNLSVSLFLNYNYFYYINQNLAGNLQHTSDNTGIFRFSSLKAKPAKDVIVQNLDGFPGNNCLSFSIVKSKLKREGDVSIKQESNHNQVSIRIINTKGYPLVIKKMNFSNAKFWKVCRVGDLTIDSSVFPVIIKSNSFADFTINFTGELIDERVTPLYWKLILRLHYLLLQTCRIFNYQLADGSTCSIIRGQLKIETNDIGSNGKILSLNGIWQYSGESNWEPSLSMVLNNFNLTSKVGFKNFDNGNNGESILPNTDEIITSGFKQANTSFPVQIIKLAAYNSFSSNSLGSDLILYDNKHLSRETNFSYNPLANQTILPAMNNNTINNNWLAINPPYSFGLRIGFEHLNREKNYKKKIGIRVWKAVGYNGTTIKNAYILGEDYLGSKGTNYDYQDNVYYIENVEPQ